MKKYWPDDNLNVGRNMVAIYSKDLMGILINTYVAGISF
jgi:hypothetical protein